jgi:hypothetical protein
MLIYIVDIDNTVCDSNKRITKLDQIYGKEWTNKDKIDLFCNPQLVKQDPIIKGAEILPQLARTNKAKIIFLTGRGEDVRTATRIWLENKLDIFNTVPLVMRPLEWSGRCQVETKIKLFRDIVLKMYVESSFVFFDDDDLLLKEYAAYGLTLKAPECWKIIRNSIK